MPNSRNIKDKGEDRYLPSFHALSPFSFSPIEGYWPLFLALRINGLNSSSQLIFDNLALLFDLSRRQLLFFSSNGSSSRGVIAGHLRLEEATGIQSGGHSHWL
jgi:hypothetical protein